MNLLLDDLTINIRNINISDILICWSWHLSDIKEVLIISKMGDLFMEKNDGGIYWLALDSGLLKKIAETRIEFEQLLNDEDCLDNWFLPSLVHDLIDAGKLLKNNQIYSYNLLPVLGGEYTLNNIEPLDISVHFTLTGEIFRQIKDLPDGTKVKLTITN